MATAATERCVIDRGIIWFQSLFFWMMPTGPGTRVVLGKLFNVSILVLLDDAYRPPAVALQRATHCRFNPCSSG